MTTIEQIKAEIERLYDELEKADCMYKDEYIAGARKTLGLVSSFLSDLESEKPIIPDLEKELTRFYLKDLCGSEKDEIPEATLHHNFPIMWDDLRDLAHHFAQWGAEHSKK